MIMMVDYQVGEDIEDFLEIVEQMMVLYKVDEKKRVKT